MRYRSKNDKTPLLTRLGVPPVYLALSVGVVAVSFAAIFIRLADAPPLVIASYRLSIGAAVMVGLSSGARWRSGVRALSAPGLTKRDALLLGVASVCLALHFGFWIASLDYTSVTSSVVLVTSNPLLVALASRLLLGEAIQRRVLAGIGVGIVGGLILAAGDASREGELLGDLLAVLGAVAIVGYLLAGRRLRTHLPVLQYTALVYSGTAVLLVVAALLAREPFTGYTLGTYGAMVLLALIPQVLGHSLFNWSLAHVTGTAVAVSVMAEPVIASLLAVPILGELPNATSVGGGLIILAGIYLALRPANVRR